MKHQAGVVILLRAGRIALPKATPIPIKNRRAGNRPKTTHPSRTIAKHKPRSKEENRVTTNPLAIEDKRRPIETVPARPNRHCAPSKLQTVRRK
jgi:hypothetical protein